MCIICIILCVYISCVFSISLKSRPFGCYSLVNWHKIFTSAYGPQNITNTITSIDNTPRTWDNIPVFMLSVNNTNILKQDDRVCSYFMDFRGATNALSEFHLHGFLDNRIFNVQTLSLRDWFRLVDPNLERIKGYSSPLLKPSPHQNNKIAYKLKKKGNQEPIPLYYCDYIPPTLLNSNKNAEGTNKIKNNVKNNTKTDTNNLNAGKNTPNRLYFFNYYDLIREIGRIEGRIEREKALKSIKVVSLLDLLLDLEIDRENLLFVPSSYNINFINKMSKHTTPWITL